MNPQMEPRMTPRMNPQMVPVNIPYEPTNRPTDGSWNCANATRGWTPQIDPADEHADGPMHELTLVPVD